MVHKTGLIYGEASSRFINLVSLKKRFQQGGQQLNFQNVTNLYAMTRMLFSAFIFKVKDWLNISMNRTFRNCVNQKYLCMQH